MCEVTIHDDKNDSNDNDDGIDGINDGTMTMMMSDERCLFIDESSFTF
jgi:hypothetical protein